MFNLSSREIFSFISFLLLLLVAAVMGDTFIRPLLIFIFTLFLLIHLGKSLEWNKVIVHKWVLLAWLLYLLFISISALFTHSIPLSLQELLFNYFGFIVFCFFLLTAKSKLVTFDSFFAGLMLLTILLITISATAQLVPVIGTELPSMTLLFPKFGHTHLASFLLLVLPISSYMLVRRKGLRSSIFFVIVCVALLLTWGRIALLIGVVQLFLMALFLLRKKLVPKIQGLLLFNFVGLLFFVSLVFIGYFMYQQATTNSCSTQVFIKYLCKPLSEEPRLEYWSQAASAIKEYPLLGYGPGTFELVNKRYRVDPTVGTAFAHNMFLELAAESGVSAAVSFSLVLLIIFITIFKQIRKSASVKVVALFLAVFGQVINGLFDYDLNHLSIFILTFICIALALKSKHFQQPTRTNFGNSMLILVTKIFFCLSMSVIFIFGSLSLVTEVLLVTKQYQLVATTFPYFVEQKQILVQEAQTNSVIYSAVKKSYLNHPEIYQELLLMNISPLEKMQFQKSLFQLYPWALFGTFDTKPYQDGMMSELKLQLSLHKSFLLQKEQEMQTYFDDQRKYLAQSYLELAEQYYDQGMYAAGNESILTAVQLRGWVLDESLLIFKYPQFPQTEWCGLLASLSEVPQSNFGQHADVYVAKMTQCFKYCFADAKCQLTQAQFATNLLTFSSTNAGLLFASFASEQLEMISTYFAEGKVQVAVEQLTDFRQVLSVLQTNGFVLDPEQEAAVLELENQLRAAQI